MSLLVRIREMVSAHSHHALDEVENPHVMAQQMLRDLSADLAQANRALVTALGAEKALLRQQQQARAEATEWQAKAERMLAVSGEELARTALERAIAAEARINEQERPLESARQSVKRLREQVARLRSEWENARARCAQIAANQNAAQALGAASRMGDHYSRAMDRAQRLDQLSRRATSFECEAEAAAELLSEHDRVDRDIARVDQQAAVESALAALKAKLSARAGITPASS